MARRALIISSPLTSPVWLSFVGTAGVGVGIVIRPGTAPLVLAQDVMGDALTDSIQAVAEAGNEIIGVIDLFG